MNNESPSQPNESTKSSGNIVTIVFSILITALVVGSLVYAWQRAVLKSTEQSLQTEITTLQSQIDELQATVKQGQSVATQDKESTKETSTESATPVGWKTYNNDKLGYSIAYPGDWEAKEYNKGEIYISYPGWRQMPEGGGSVVISVEDKTLEQFIQEYNSSDVLDDGTALSKIIKQENYTIGGVGGHKLVGTTAIGLDQSFIFISRANKAYVIQFHDYDDAHLNIISTFRFN